MCCICHGQTASRAECIATLPVFGFRDLMRECHPDKAAANQKHVANTLTQYLNGARDRLQASL